MRIQIGHKSGYLFIYLFYLLFSVNIKPSRHRFGLSLAWDWQYTKTKTFTLPGSGETFCGGGWVLKNILVFSFDQAEQFN